MKIVGFKSCFSYTTSNSYPGLSQTEVIKGADFLEANEFNDF